MKNDGCEIGNRSARIMSFPTIEGKFFQSRNFLGHHTENSLICIAEFSFR